MVGPRGGGPERVRIHYRRLPDHEKVYDQAVVSRSDEVIITLSERLRMERPMVVNGRVMLEEGSRALWFTFPGLWHDIGLFHTADGAPTGLYANVLTPPILRDPEWYTTDLFLDVWWPAGGAPELLDEDEFRAAWDAGLMEGDTADRARAEAHALLQAAASGSWPPPVVREWSLDRALESLHG